MTKHNLQDQEITEAACITSDEIEKAYQALSSADKAVIDALVEQLEQGLQARRREQKNVHLPAQFGPKGAREVLAKVGIWIVKRPVRRAMQG